MLPKSMLTKTITILLVNFLQALPLAQYTDKSVPHLNKVYPPHIPYYQLTNSQPSVTLEYLQHLYFSTQHIHVPQNYAKAQHQIPLLTSLVYGELMPYTTNKHPPPINCSILTLIASKNTMYQPSHLVLYQQDPFTNLSVLIMSQHSSKALITLFNYDLSTLAQRYVL
jgi:hypothetical protein